MVKHAVARLSITCNPKLVHTTPTPAAEDTKDAHTPQYPPHIRPTYIRPISAARSPRDKVRGVRRGAGHTCVCAYPSFIYDKDLREASGAGAVRACRRPRPGPGGLSHRAA